MRQTLQPSLIAGGSGRTILIAGGERGVIYDARNIGTGLSKAVLRKAHQYGVWPEVRRWAKEHPLAVPFVNQDTDNYISMFKDYIVGDYIEKRDVTSYIDTGIIPDDKSEITFICSHSDFSLDPAHVGPSLSCFAGSSRLTIQMRNRFRTGEEKWSVAGNFGYVTYNSVFVNEDLSVKKKNYIYISKGILKVNDESFKINDTVSPPKIPLGLFCSLLINGNADDLHLSGICYEIIHEREGEIVNHQYPCISKLSNAPGMYDVKTGQFHTNKGKGNLIVM